MSNRRDANGKHALVAMAVFARRRNQRGEVVQRGSHQNVLVLAGAMANAVIRPAAIAPPIEEDGG
jgi:hypothetical protein